MAHKTREPFLDLQGKQTGFLFGKKQALGVLAAITGFILIRVIPFSLWGLPPAGQTILAILCFTVILYVTVAVPSMLATFLMIVLLVLTKTMSLNDILANMGTSPMIMIMALLIISKGMMNTTLAARISYLFIAKLGTSPLKLIIALVASTAVISTFIADIPSTAIVGTIAFGILKEMHEEPGKSKLGRGLMLAIPLASCVGGVAVINGSGINVAGLAILEKVTNGEFSVSYNQWASIGIPFALIMIIPLSLCTYYCFGIHKKEEHSIQLSKEYFVEKLKELGPLNNPEKRFLITVTIMMTLFLTSDFTKFAIPLIAFIAMCIVIMPAFGTVNVNEALKTITWDMLFLIAAGTALAVGISTTGLGAWLAEISMGWAVDLPVFVVMFVVATIGCLSHVVIVGSATSVVNVFVPALIPIALASGIHPALLAMVAISTGTPSTLMPIDATILVTSEYGYYKMSDIYKVGPALSIVWILTASIIFCVMGPMVGLVL